MDATDFCDEKLLTFYLNDTETKLINATNTGKIYLSVPTNTTEYGYWQASVIATMKNYTFIKSDPIYFDVTILKSEVPVITYREYRVGTPLL